MKLLRLHVENFGALHDFDLSFRDGMNLLYQKNGWGKTTLAVFIKAMLYGLPSSTKRSLDENERKKYTPWQGGAYGGSLEFEDARGSYRIERFFGAKESGDSFALYDLATNKPSNAYSEALGEELFGIDADGFERSTYLSQRALSGSKDSGSIAAKLGNLLDDVDDIGNYEVALAALDKRRRYYVMTGNRGAIAELDEAIALAQRELEACRRTEEAMRTQEQALAEKQSMLQAVRRTAGENRERLTKAGLARERNAHLAQKKRLEGEIHALQAEKASVDRCFYGRVPTVDELTEGRRLLKELDAAEAERRTLQTSHATAAEASRLKQRFQGGVPSQEAIEEARRDHERLPALRAKHELLGAETADVRPARFAKGMPTQEALNAARKALSEANSLQVSIETFSQEEQKNGKKDGKGLKIWASIACVVGVLLLASAILPILQGRRLPVLLGGAAMLILGGVLAILWRTRCGEANRRNKEMRARLDEWRTKRENGLREVKSLLARYGMPTDDPERSLTELSLAVDQYRKQDEQMAKRQGELERLQLAMGEILKRLYGFLSRYFVELEKKNDYRPELDELDRDLSAWRRMRAEEQTRAAQIRENEQRLTALRAELTPLLQHYDRDTALTPTECLDLLSDRLAEHRRLERELTAKSAELQSFIAEKQLENAETAFETDSIEELNREEQELRERATLLEKDCAALRSRIEHFSSDVDRIPELEAELVRLRLARDEAKANAATVTHTMKLLEESKTALSTRYLAGMQESFDGFLQELTDKQAPEAVMDSSFEIRMREGGQTRTMESFSRGWRDAVELCVRLSLTDALYREGERPFLLLDDPLVNLDDERLAAARALLEKLAEKYQILYFVCHKDRI